MEATGLSHKYGERYETRFHDKIFLSTYVCDFGNIVINSNKKKQFKISNWTKFPIDLILDTKSYKQFGFTITPERPPKIGEEESITLTINYQTKKNFSFGKKVTKVPIEIKHGPKYMVKK